MNDYTYWVQNVLDKRIKKQLKTLTEEQKTEFFAKNLEFGTAGMRGVMRVGTFGMNELTVCKLAYSVAGFLSGMEEKSVVIGFDSRNNSKKFSRIFAKVLLAFGAKVYLFKDYAPTPLSVFMTTKFKATLGVMITASHNNKTFNGIKIYDSNGIQINDDVQIEISNIYNRLNEVDVYNQIYNQKVKSKPIYISRQQTKEFVENSKSDTKKDLKIVYTPLNGTGLFCVDKILKQNGYNYFVPSSQKNGNGEFKTCPYPNPEFVEAFAQSIKLAKKIDADIIVATDPDADRIGVMAKHNGEYVKLSGNEVAYVFAQYLISTNKKPNSYVVSSVVTSPLLKTICESNGIEFHQTLTGFLSLGTKAKQLSDKYGRDCQLLVCEESCGYVVNGKYFDKDGIYSTLMLCDIAHMLKQKNQTLVDYLDDIYQKYGYIATLGDSIMFEGANSKEKMSQVVNNLRENPPKIIANEQICSVVDYLNDNTGLKPQNFFEYSTKSIKLFVRPSGTEPKLKLYIFAKGQKTQAQELVKQVDDEIKLLLK